MAKALALLQPLRVWTMLWMWLFRISMAPCSFKVNSNWHRAAGRALEISDLESLNDDVTVGSEGKQAELLATGDTQAGAVENCGLAWIALKGDVSRCGISGAGNSDGLVVHAPLHLDRISRMHSIGRMLNGAPGRAERARIGVVARGRNVI